MPNESVEASLVMLGSFPALVAKPLPHFIDMEDVETGNGVTVFEEFDDRMKIEAYYDFHVAALRFVRRGE